MADPSDPPRPPDGAGEAPTAPVSPALPGGVIPDGWLLAALMAAGDAATVEGDAPEGTPTVLAPTPDGTPAPAAVVVAPTPLAQEYVRLVRRPGAAGADAPLALGRFEVIGVLGQGGFGTVYLARDPRLKRLVALKVPLPQMVLSAGARERFLREGRAAARLRHDAIVQVLDVEEPNPIGTIAYAYWPGPTLAQWLRAQTDPVSPRRAAVLVATLADAVAHAHAMGVLHRDIKPANVILTAMENAQDRGLAPPDGDAPGADAGAATAEVDPLPKLTDFGLARVTGEGPDDMKTGAPFGTPPYMAPEQAAGLVRQVGPWTDVYALGAVLYEVLAGRPPFQGDSPTETMLQVLQDDPVAPRTLRRGLPRDLETIVLRCLQKVPARRYASAEALRDDLRRFLAGRPIAARPEWLAAKGLRWLRRRPALFAALVVAALTPLVLLVGMLAWNAALRDLNAQLRLAKLGAEASAERALRHLYGADLREAADALAAGQPERAQELLALLAAKPGWERSREFTWRYVRDAARRPLVLLSGPEERISAIAASPDGRRIATGDRDGTLRLRDASGTLLGQVRTPLGPVWGVALAPDGMRVAAFGPDAGGVVLGDPESGGILARFATGPDEAPLGLRFGGDPDTLWLLVARGGQPPPELVRLRAVREGPRGAMALRAAGRWPAAGALAVAADGRRVARRDVAPGSLVVADAESGAVLWRAPHGGGAVDRAAISADGRRVAAVVARTGGQDLVVWDVATGAERGRHPATDEPFVALGLSADGSLVVGRQHGGRTLVRGDGVRWDVEPITGDPDRPTGGVSLLDPLGRTVAVSQQSIVGGPQPLRVHDAATGAPRAEFPGSLQRTIEAAYADGGRRLAVRSGHRALAWPLDPAPDPQPAGHAREAWDAAFTPDGAVLVTGSDDVGEPLTVRTWDAATGAPIAAWKAHPGTTAALAVHPDRPLLATVGLATAANLRLWELPSGQFVADLPGNAGWLRAVAFSPDGTWLAVAGNERVVRLHDVATRRVVHTLEGATDTLRAVAFSPDGKWLVAGGNDGAVRAWDLADLDAPPRVAGGDLHVAALAYTPDGATLVVGEEEGGLLFRDARTLAVTRRLDSGCEELRCLAIAPDGRTLAAPAAPGTVALWDLQTGQRLATVAVGPAKLQGLRFAPDGSALAVCDYAGGVRLLRAPAPR